MESFALDLLFKSLISVTLSFTAVIIPFAGAVWIYKKTNLSAAESKIYETGRDIATTLHDATDIRSPLVGMVYSYIDDAISDIEEPNRDEAIHKLVKNTCMEIMFNSDNEDFDSQAAATLLVAITADRFASLVPLGIKWSGQGPVHSIFGEDISLEDNLFPFGTKLYQQWIKRFSLIHKNLWVTTSPHSRRLYVGNFANRDEYTSEDDVNTWLDDVQTTLRKVNALHSKLITQLLIIESNIDLKGFRSSLLASGLFLFLLVVSGYFLPTFLLELDERSWVNLSLLSLASASLIVLVVSRLVYGYDQQRDSQVQRGVLFPPFQKFLGEIKPDTLRFKYDRVDNILSMKRDLDLPNGFCQLLSTCSAEMKEYNKAASAYAKEVAALIPSLLQDFPNQRNNKSGFSIAIADFARDSYDLDAIENRILSEDTNLFFSHEEQHSTRKIYTVNLAEQSTEQRQELVNHMNQLRLQARDLKSYSDFSACWLRLDSAVESLKERTKKLIL